MAEKGKQYIFILYFLYKLINNNKYIYKATHSEVIVLTFSFS